MVFRSFAPSFFCRAPFLAMLCLLLSTGAARADWLLDLDKSNLTYGSIKNGSIGESNHFQKMEGRITEAGDMRLVIDLASVETWADIRNDRMRDFLFETAAFPVATLQGQVDMTKFASLAIGDRTQLDTTFNLSLHGHDQIIEAELMVFRLSEKTVVVIPREFIFLDAEKFDLLPGLKKLQELAKLPSISPAVPVTFHLTFTQTP